MADPIFATLRDRMADDDLETRSRMAGISSFLPADGAEPYFGTIRTLKFLGELRPFAPRRRRVPFSSWGSHG